MRFTGQDIASAVGGRAGGPPLVVDGVVTDSRRAVRGKLFVPVRGRRDGHDYIGEALWRGASAYLTERADTNEKAIFVLNTLDALKDLAVFARERLGARRIGITGSVGKTTTKDLTRAVLAATLATYASERSFNNYLGVPLTVLNAPDACEALVLEIGTNAPGEIAALCRIALPEVGVVTRVARAHTEGFGDEAGVADEKADLVRALPPNGLAVLNADDPLVAGMAREARCPVLFFGAQGDVRVRLVSIDAELRPRLQADTPWGRFETVLAARGRHQVVNAGAAIAVGGYFGVPTGTMAGALAEAPISAGRMAVRTARAGFRVIDDSYNSNPESTRAALQALADLPASRRIAIVGEMAELGAVSRAEHEAVRAVAERLGIEMLAVRAPEYGVENFEDFVTAAKRVEACDEGTVVLVKGSRASALEHLVESLCGPEDAEHV
jgi:UDP-N-acetylmuramoyl-tripeptide--D-alanyl-D-alanine ligase